jgi:hypothetical protein
VVWLFHNLLLGSEEEVEGISRAVAKVVENARLLAAV